VHGLDKAMGIPASKLPWAVFVVGITGSDLHAVLPGVGDAAGRTR
jgi:hypothetical protein